MDYIIYYKRFRSRGKVLYNYLIFYKVLQRITFIMNNNIIVLSKISVQIEY